MNILTNIAAAAIITIKKIAAVQPWLSQTAILIFIITRKVRIVADLIPTDLKNVAAKAMIITNIMNVTHIRMNMQNAAADIIMKKNIIIMRDMLAVQNMFILMTIIAAAVTTIPTLKTAWIRTGMSQKLSRLNINFFFLPSVH